MGWGLVGGSVVSISVIVKKLLLILNIIFIIINFCGTIYSRLP